jgi:26S proteasome regulatory subunit N3
MLSWILTVRLTTLLTICYLSRRIMFCLDVHNEAVKSMRYPPDAYKKDSKSSDKPEPDEKTIDELIKEIEEDME